MFYSKDGTYYIDGLCRRCHWATRGCPLMGALVYDLVRITDESETVDINNCPFFKESLKVINGTGTNGTN